MKKITTILILGLMLICNYTMAQTFKLTSDDKSFVFTMQLKNGLLNYSLSKDNFNLLKSSQLGIDFDKESTSVKSIKSDSAITQHQEQIKWRLGESNLIQNNYKQQIFSVINSNNQSYKIEVRIFDNSITFRYITDKQSQIFREKNTFILPDNTSIYKYQEESEINKVSIDSLDVCDLPATLSFAKGYLFIGEANNSNYTKSVLKKSTEKNSLIMYFLKDKIIKTGKDYFETPWRTVSYAKDAVGLHRFSDLFFVLTDGVKTVPDWIKPGKVMRTELNDIAVKETIDFTAKNGFQYVLLDAGWYGPERDPKSDPRTYIPALNIPELVAYGKSKNIGLILYVNYIGLSQHLEESLAVYKKWGIAGMKFGFVDGLTQKGIIWLENAVKKSYENGFLINVHDNYKPSGLIHRYPSWLSQEGIRGNEHGANATHNTILPFTRFLAGPGDFTIGYLNSNQSLTNRYDKLGFNVSKAHQLALSVVFYSPLQAIFWYGKPSDYTNQAEIEFFTKVPTVWDASNYLDGEIGKKVIVARKKGEEWFIGAICSEECQHQIYLSFLNKNTKYLMDVYEDDGTESIKKTTLNVDKSSVYTIKMNANSGVAIQIKPVK